jgi:hypothetical protein
MAGMPAAVAHSKFHLLFDSLFAASFRAAKRGLELLL